MVLGHFFHRHAECFIEFMRDFAQYFLQNNKLTNTRLIEFGNKPLDKLTLKLVEWKEIAEAWAQEDQKYESY